MSGLYLVSSEGYTGKTLACMVLARRYAKRGLNPGYFKPIGHSPAREGGVWVDRDAALVLGQLGLDDPMHLVCPLLVTPALLVKALGGEIKDGERLVVEAYRELAKTHNPMLVGGSGSAILQGALLGLTAPRIAEILGARVLLVQKAEDALCVDPVLACAQAFGERLAGVIFNNVPEQMLEPLATEIAPFLARQGVQMLGVIPHDPVLHSVSVRELVERMGAQVLSGEEHLDELIENFVVGAMNVEHALNYLRRTPAKALVTAGERTDLQLTALETSTKAIILTGQQQPDHLVLSRARATGVPVILSMEDTFGTVARIEEVLGKIRMTRPEQLARAEELFREGVALERIDEVLGLG